MGDYGFKILDADDNVEKFFDREFSKFKAVDSNGCV
jgi:hypothetical protein